MDDQDHGKNIEDFFDPTDSEDESSSSSNHFETQPFILDVHELTKGTPNPDPVRKVKKTKKKKKTKSQGSVSSGSTVTSVPPVIPPALEEQPAEEFYDAHESFHALPEKQLSNPVAPAALVIAHSEHGQDPKQQEILDHVAPIVALPGAPIVAATGAPVVDSPAAAPEQKSSAIIKPVTGPE